MPMIRQEPMDRWCCFFGTGYKREIQTANDSIHTFIFTLEKLRLDFILVLWIAEHVVQFLCVSHILLEHREQCCIHLFLLFTSAWLSRYYVLFLNQ